MEPEAHGMNQINEKIKLIVSVNDFRVGGAQKIVCDVLSELNPQKFDLHLLTLQQLPGETTLYSDLPQSVSIHQINFGSFYDFKSWLKLFKLLRSIGPEVVWSNLFFSNTVMRVMAVFMGFSVVVTEHNTYQWKSWQQKLIDRVLSSFTYRIVAVSNRVKEHTLASSSISESKFTVIPNGVDFARFARNFSKKEKTKIREELGIGLDDRVVICVGQLIRQKNHELLIYSFSKLDNRYSDCRLLILGEGTERDNLESQIARLDLKDRVLMPGIKKNTEAHYAISDFFVLSSRFEGFGIVCIEAMAAGLPVIATKVAGPDEYIKVSQNGFFTEANPVSMSEKIQYLLDLPASEKQRMREGARTTARNYDLSKVATAYSNLFKQAADS